MTGPQTNAALPAASVALALLICPVLAGAEAYWPTFGYDARRTHQSPYAGPTTLDAERIRTFTADCDVHINTSATIDDGGNLFFGTWGVARSDGSTDRTGWTKGDGKIYGLTWDLQPLWPALDPAQVQFCYQYGDRDLNRLECPGPGVWNGYNGTVEGVGAIGPDGIIYFGRGDGGLYAVDMETGQLAWSFQTYNPEDLDDPEGGGELLTPTLVHEGVVYFATSAPPNIPHVAWESNAIYGVEIASQGANHWRYPPEVRTLEGEEFLAAPAVSPDGNVVYFGSLSATPNTATNRPHLFAFDADVDWDDPDPLRWVVETHDPALPDSTILVDRLVVGSDGDLFIGGTRMRVPASGDPFTNPLPAVLRLDDEGQPVWDGARMLPNVLAGHLVQGFSLRESETGPEVLYAAQGFNNALGGGLNAIDAATGEVSWTWYAGQNEVQGAVNDPTIDVDGNLFFGVRGTVADGGWIIALDPDGDELWRYQQDRGAIDWSPPALGRNGSLYWGDRALEVVPYAVYEPGECPELDVRPRLWALLGDEPDEPDESGPSEGVDDVGGVVDAGDYAEGGSAGDDGCGCAATGSSPTPLTWLVWMPGLLWLGRLSVSEHWLPWARRRPAGYLGDAGVKPASLGKKIGHR